MTKGRDCVQCKATTKDGQRCKLQTCVRYPYCWIHLKSIDKLQVKNSSISGAGKGLYYVGKTPIAKDHKIVNYSAKQVSKEKTPDSKYNLQIGKARFLDSKNPLNFVGRYINATKGTDKQPNVRFTRGTIIYDKDGRKTVPIYTKKRIQPNTELLLNYGSSYWT